MRNIRKIWSIILALAFILGGLGLSRSSVKAAGFEGYTIIKSGQSVTKDFQLSKTQQKLIFKIVVPSTGYVDIGFHLEDAYLGSFNLYYGDDSDVSIKNQSLTTSSSTKVANEKWSLLLNPGNYYIVYKNYGSQYIEGQGWMYDSGKLRVSYSFESLNVSSIDKEDNDSIPKASYWDYKNTPSIKGSFAFKSGDRYDTYKIQIDSTAEYKIKYESSDYNHLTIYDSEGENIKKYYAEYNKAYAKYMINDSISLSAGTYYLSADSHSNVSYYTLTFEKVVKQQSNSNNNTSTSYSNEWVNGKWYDSQGKQTYKGTLSWKSNSKGWWVEDSQGWYPTNSWQKIDGVWYFFRPDGYMASGEYYYGYWFNYNGSWDASYYLTWRSNSRGWWVEDRSGWWPANKWLKIDGCWYYFNGSGYMVTNQYVDGYWIGADGVCR